MNNWRFVGTTVDQTTLAVELHSWLAKVTQGVYVFREGATISQLDWGDEQWVTKSALDRCWSVRLFCQEFELFARRLDFADKASWQMRLGADAEHLSQGDEASPCQTETVLLLGTSTGEPIDPLQPFEHTRFDLEPNRYRRMRLSYPGQWNRAEQCALAIRRFQPLSGPAIVCWTGLCRFPVEVAAGPITLGEETNS